MTHRPVNPPRPCLPTLCLSFLAAAWWCGAAGAAQPTGLLCELVAAEETAVVSDPAPEFSWVVPPESGDQVAYQVVVASREELLHEGAGDLWDSGRVESDQSLAVEYGGRPLSDRRESFWRVRVWGESGGVSEWSAAARLRVDEREGADLAPTRALTTTRVKPKRVDKLDDGRRFLDFGRDAFGYLELEGLNVDEPTRLTVRFGEMADGQRVERRPGGSIRYGRVRVEASPDQPDYDVHPPVDRRNTNRRAGAILLPDRIGVVMPFRYVEIEGAPDGWSADAARLVMVHYPFDEDASYFASSDEALNRIWEFCKYSIKATTFAGVYVDGDRERIPYEADAYINQLSHYACDREYALARYSHEYLLLHPTWPTEWKQHSILMAWEDYLYTGDAESLEQFYDLLAEEKLLDQHERPDGLLDTGDLRDIVDWPEGERDDYDFRPVNTVVNCFHYRTLVLMGRIAEALGKHDDAAGYAADARRTRAAINDKLFDEGADLYIDGEGSDHSSLHANLFALAFDVPPAGRRDRVVDFLKSKGMACSVYAAQFLLDGLYENGAAEYGRSLITSDGPRSWLNMLREGSTITMEAWGRRYKPNLDWNHAWGAAPANVIMRQLVGVRPHSPGGREVLIRPRPGRLESFEAKAPLIVGAVEAAYRRTDDGYRLEVTLPANTTAALDLPAMGGGALVEIDDRPAPFKALGDGMRVTAPLDAGAHTVRVQRD